MRLSPSKALPWLIGFALPAALILTNTIYGYAGILLTIAALAWIGFALALMPQSATSHS